MTLVDGCESGYYMDSALRYSQTAAAIRAWNGACAKLVAPELREKYRRQVQAGFGFYLDMFENEPGNQYYFPPLDGSRLKRLQRNLGFALDAADEYVWIYGEQCKWWDCYEEWSIKSVQKLPGKGRFWEEAMPGIKRALAWASDPVGFAESELARGAVTNLLKNADFKNIEDKHPACWDTWQDESSHGTFSDDRIVGNGSARAENARHGVFLQKVPAKPGEHFHIKAQCKRQGSSVCFVLIRWQRDDGQWTLWVDDKSFTFAPTKSGWEEAHGIVTVPEDTGQLVVLLVASHQLSATDVCWFDNTALYRIEP